MIYSTKNFNKNIKVVQFVGGSVCTIDRTSDTLLWFSGLINANLLYVSKGKSG
jgi:hypothetical protein